MLKILKYLFWDDAKWWEFWRAQSGSVGGMILALILLVVLLLTNEITL